MATVTLRPNGSTETYNPSNQFSIGGGAGSLHAAVNDDSDLTWIKPGTNAAPPPPPSDVTFDFTTFAFPARSIIKSLTPRMRMMSANIPPQNSHGALWTEGNYGSPWLAPNPAVTVQSTIQTQTCSYVLTTSADGSPLTQAAVDSVQMRQTGIAGYGSTTIQTYEIYLDALYVPPAVTTVTAPTGGISNFTPAVTWTSVLDGDGGAQTSYEVKFFTQAQYGAAGFDPSFTAPRDWSGVLSGAGLTWTPTNSLPGGTSRAYVRVGQTVNGATLWGDWGFKTFLLPLRGRGVQTKVARAARVGGTTLTRGILFEIDPTSENATNTPLSLLGTVGSVKYGLRELDVTPPEIDPRYASSADTEGDPFVDSRYRNRTLTLKIFAQAPNDLFLQAGIYAIQQKLEKLRRERGTIKFTTMPGSVVVGDVLFVRMKVDTNRELYGLRAATEFELAFECKPFFRGQPKQLADHVETTLPACIGVDTNVLGDVSALVKILIDNDQAANQDVVIWGIQSRYYDPAATAALFYEAESRTPLGGAALAVGASSIWEGVPSGAGNNVVSATRTSPSWNTILSTQAASGGAHLTHKGTFRVYARMWWDTFGDVPEVALEWTTGDFVVVTRNASYQLVERDAYKWKLVDLGLVTIDPSSTRWEGRIVLRCATSYYSVELQVDYLMLVPVNDGFGIVTSRPLVPDTGVVLTAHDEFQQAAGALNAKALPLGGTWVTSGATTDFVNAVSTVTSPYGMVNFYSADRTTTADGAPGGRFAIASSTVYTNGWSQIDFRWSAIPAVDYTTTSGPVIRYVDASNFLQMMIHSSADLGTDISFYQYIAGSSASPMMRVTLPTMIPNQWYSARLAADAQGKISAYFGKQGELELIAQGYGPEFAVGGVLGSGMLGFWDGNSSGAANTRSYDNFAASAYAPDAAIFASQSLELGSAAARREDATGTMWGAPGSYEGDRPMFPAAGLEGRSVRTLVKALRFDPDLVGFPDVAMDDISYRATVTPRYLILPGLPGAS